MSFGPWTLCSLWLRPETPLLKLVGQGLLVLGAGYFPMALLAVLIYDSLAALNPLLVLVSILRTARRYLALCVCLGSIAGSVFLIQAALTPLGHPSLTSTVGNLGWVYLALVAMRATGWFYYCSKEQLAWG